MREVIECIDIFQKMALLEISHTAGRTIRIQLMRSRVCLLIEFIIIKTFVDSHTPEKDRRMIPVLHHHFSDILNTLLSPSRVGRDMLPAGNLSEHCQPNLVTGIEKILALRVMGCSDCIDLQLCFQNSCIFSLKALGCRIANIRVALMTIQTAQEYLLSIEQDMILIDRNRPDSKMPGNGIKNFFPFLQRHLGLIQIRILHRPEMRIDDPACMGMLRGRPCL